MQVTHLKTNSKNESEFGSIEISLDRQGVEQFANLRAPHGMIFNETDAGHEYPWHNAPQRQWVVTLQGEIEVKLRNGESKRFSAGSLLLADDLEGSGHATLLMDALFSHSALSDIQDFELYCQPGLAELYGKWGFEPSPNGVIFMRAKRTPPDERLGAEEVALPRSE